MFVRLLKVAAIGGPHALATLSAAQAAVVTDASLDSSGTTPATATASPSPAPSTRF